MDLISIVLVLLLVYVHCGNRHFT